jgi:putative hydrolase of the HAD superfamily
MIKLIIFDFDNTLVNTRDATIKALKYVYKKIKPKVSFKKFFEICDNFERNYNFKRREWFYYFTKNWKKAKELEKIYWEIVMKNTKVFKGVREILKKLKRKYKIVLLTLTDGKKGVKMRRIKRLKLDKYFDKIYIGIENVKEYKPKISAFKRVLKDFKVKPKEVIMVGDNYERDILPAKKLKIFTISFRKRNNADKVIKNFNNLIKIINYVNSF